MPYCAILKCQSNSRTKNRVREGISYHRFPKNPYVKEKWIEATGRLNWMPSKSSTICSEHFAEKSILTSNKGYRYIAENAVPTLKIMMYHAQYKLSIGISSCSVKRSSSIIEEPDSSLDTPRKKDRIEAIDLETQKDSSNVLPAEQPSVKIQESNATADAQSNLPNCSMKHARDIVEAGPSDMSKKKALIETEKDFSAVLAIEQTLVKCEESDGPFPVPVLKDIQNVTPCSSLYSTPKKKKLGSMLRWSRNIIRKKNLQIKRLQTKNRRLKRKIESMEQLLKELGEKFAMSNENLICLKNTNVEVNELISRQARKGESGVTSKKKYSPELRCFALTLHFYSPKAYDYVRKIFSTCLPDPRTLRRWYSKVGGEPGFTKESFAALKFKAQRSNQLIAAALVIDEMSIRRRIEWDGQKLHGYVDMGTGMEGDHLAEAKEALVFLVTAINCNFKVPIAFFLVDGVTGLQRAELVKQAMELIHEAGVMIVALTFDGCAANLSMAGHLGCDFQKGNIKFPHPVTNDTVVAILDPCHMIKLLRNSFEYYKTFIDKDGKKIEWKYLTQLNKQQQDETFHLSNKLRDRHINFKNERMKVKLATQLFSLSVAEALKFCRIHLKIGMFQNSEATENFLIICNNIFDIFNSRNLYFHGFKKALNANNSAQVFQYLDMASNYISNLKMENGILLIKSPRKTGFLGFLGCIEAQKHLYSSLIESKILLYLPFYKLSQDHLELLFCNIRSHGGSNNNPTARQFIAAYKKILVHVELKNTDKGNCTELEQISILTCSSAVERINKSTSHEIVMQDNQSDEIDTYLEFQEIGECLSEFGNQAVGHIAGYIVRTLIKRVKCDVCVSGLVTKEISSFHKFIVATDKGGLLYPSADVFKICQTAELCLKACEGNMKKEIILNKVMRQFVGIDLFSNISFHQLGQFPSSNHITDLIKSIVERYINVRLHHLLKMFVKLSKRQLLNKYILFQGQ